MSRGSNLDKHTSKNPLVKLLNGRLVTTISEFALKNRPKKILDAGCGEGFIVEKLRSENGGIEVIGLDIEKDALKFAQNLNPGIKFIEGSVYELPFDDDSFDVVILSEVLEHLQSPRKALKEINRVTNSYCVVSVPNEPVFRLGNVARLTYLSDFGNGPGHINHWSKKKFLELLSKTFDIQEVKTPLPWVSALCIKK